MVNVSILYVVRFLLNEFLKLLRSFVFSVYMELVYRYLKIKQLSGNINHFKKALKKFLLQGSFYTMEEFLDWTSINDLYTLYL
jgi:hypothetical protein